MKVRYDEKVDILYIKLKESPYHESDEIKDGIVLDYDKKGKVIGIEILDASEYLEEEELSTVKFNLNRVVTENVRR